MTVFWSRVAYLSLTVIVTIWVAKALHRNGRPFLVDVFGGDERTADAVNQLLVLGFYLVNIGLAAWSVKYGARPSGLQSAIETVAGKLGWAFLILGGMHFFNVIVLSRIRRRKLSEPREIVEFLEA
ncbi:MAG: hypothetical protein ACE5KM_16380 [Planctomycetaceae bacterium]